MRAPAVVFAAVDDPRLLDAEIPAPDPGEIGLAVRLSAVSPGTELRALSGRQAGLTEFPFVPGYALVGEDAAGRRWFHGGSRTVDPVPGWGGHVSRATVPAGAAIPLPEGLDEREAVLVKMWAIAWRGVAMAKARPGERVAIVGLGLIGQLSARLFAAEAGLEVVAVDPEPARRALFPGTSATPEEAGGGFDVVVDATGFVGALPSSVARLRDLPWQGPGEGAQLVIQGSYPGDFPLSYDDLFRKEATIHFPRDNRRDDAVVLLDRLARGEITGRDLVGEPRRPEDAPAVYAELKGRGAAVTAAFDWCTLRA